MTKAISNAFTFMKQDSDWVFKLSILALFLLPTSYIQFSMVHSGIGLHPTNIGFEQFLKSFLENSTLSVLIESITYPFVWGYLSVCTHNVINNTDKGSFLPRWEDGFFNYYNIGIKYSVAILIFGLAVIVPGVLTIGILFLAFAFIYPALNNIFCQDYEITSFLFWKKAYSNGKESSIYWPILGISIVIGILLQVLNSFIGIFKLPIIVEATLFTVVNTYLLLILAYIYGLVGQKQ